jgi:diamine N-acetyltransferase
MHRRWWEKYRALDDDFVFIIEDLQGEARPVGQVSVYHVAWDRREAEYGRCVVAPEASGRNVLFRASLALFEVTRAQLRLDRLYLQVKADNAKARHIYEKLGFAVTRAEGGQVYMDRRL